MNYHCDICQIDLTDTEYNICDPIELTQKQLNMFNQDLRDNEDLFLCETCNERVELAKCAFCEYDAQTWTVVGGEEHNVPYTQIFGLCENHYITTMRNDSDDE
jgi:hypothetical protein